MKQETQNELERFRDYLREQEKSSHTIEKYCRDVRKFLMFVGEERGAFLANQQNY